MTSHPSRVGRRWPALRTGALVLAMLGGCTSSDSDHASPVDDALATRLQAALDEAMADEEDATIAVAALDVAGRRWIGRAGPSSSPDSADTPFLLASVTKTYLAALTLELVGDGRLALDDSAQLGDNQDPVTVRQLLNHTSGLPDGECAPGSCHHYDDVNYVMLGRALAARTGSSIGDLVDGFLDDHGLDNTAYAPTGELPPGTHVHYAGADIADREDARRFVQHTGAAGAMVSTAEDVLQFGHLLFGGAIVEPALLAEMVDPEPTIALPCRPDDCVGRYGLGVEISRIRGHPAVGHEGSTGAFLAHVTDEDVTIVVLTDADGAGRRIALRLAEAAGIEEHADVWTISHRGAALTRLTDSAGIDGGPAWSPEGDSIVFGSTRDGQPELYVMNADGTDERRLTDHPAADGAGRYSPDGSRIVFASDRTGNSDIWTMAADGSDLRQLTSAPEDERLPSYAPDGRIVFEIGPDGDRDLVVIDADGANQTRFELPGDQFYASWSSTGDRIAFRQPAEGIWTIEADGTGARPVPGTHPGDRFPAWGPDGTLAFVDRAGDIWTVRPDGTDRRRLGASIEEEYGPWWSPDGRTLVFPSDRGPIPREDRAR